MKVFVVALFGCLLSVQAIPSPTLGLLSDATGLLGGVSGGVSGGLSIESFVSAILSGFGSDGSAVPSSFLNAFKAGFANIGPDGSIPISDFTSGFNGACSGSSFPFNIIDGALSSILGSGGNSGSGGFASIFVQLFGSAGQIPASVVSQFSGILSQDNVSPDEFASVLKSAYAAANASGGDANSVAGASSGLPSGVVGAASNAQSNKNSLSYQHNENSESTSLNAESEGASGAASSFAS